MNLTHTITTTSTAARILGSAFLAFVAFIAAPLPQRRPRHAVRAGTPAHRAVVPVGQSRPARHYAPLQGGERVAFRVVAGALVAVTVLIAWYGFDLAAFIAGGAS